MTDAELNQNIKSQPYDWIVKNTFLWMFPAKWGIRPNHITIARFIASPFVFWLLWQQQYKIGLIAFFLTALTDAIDGAMARTRGQITVWGTIYDSVADKFLIGGVALILVLQHLGLWLAGLIVALELISALGALYFKWRRGIVRSALLWGKIKMNLQVFATMLLLAHIIWDISPLSAVSAGIFGASAVTALINMIAHIKIRI